MDAVVMCGGQGTRLESSREKPLYPIDGVAMIDRVVAALAESDLGNVSAAVSPNAPETRTHLDADDRVRTIETAGDGYVADLQAVLDRPAIDPPILTAAADLPLLTASVVDHVLDRYAAVIEGGAGTAAPSAGTPSLTVSVPVALKRRLGASVDSRLEPEPHLAPTGINVVGSTDESMIHIAYDPRLSVNVNRLEDADAAASLLGGGATA